MFSLLSLGIALASLKTGLAAVYDDPSQLPTDKQYDFVVVGAGTAGNVIAARLAENANTSVLVVEAGRNNVGYDSDLITIPFLGPQASPHTSFDWNYTTVPQEPLNNQLIAYPRGYVFGGSSSTNYMVYTRGSSDDYDRFAELAGDDGWNWDNLFPYALKNEKHVPPNDGHNETGQYIPSMHGTDGPLETSLYGYAADIDNRVIATTSELSEEFPWNPDYNSGNMLGVSWMHSTIGGPLRSSSATAYLVPALSNYSNLDLVYNSQVTRLVQNGEIDGLPVFTTVEFAKNPTAPRYNVSATREVILSAGAIGTPQILMLSGIGRSLDLTAVGINPIVDLPEVGQNLVDHPLLPIQWNANSNETLDPLFRGGAAFDAALEQYHANGTGRLAANGVSNNMAFYRLPENSSVLAEFEDPTSGPGAPHYEHAFANGFFTTSQTQPTSGSYFSIINVIVTPTSRGAITLASNDPFQHPTIDPKMLTSDYDVSVMIESVKAAQRFAAAHAWDGYITGPYIDSVNATTDDGIKELSKEDGEGVADGQLLLKKARGVRIVDASVFPIIPAGHPQAMIYIVAERAADVIKATWGM
ncbi:aryl-alcohol oxidase-like protein [Desarmillaria tabescens]|uniref:Aryl-alcohol oxidase-like protein n=1 Tax=Armillaria tabescens TaxID=1929756 RepID=A0AA39TTQ0_ARMTA|nr:aryl-alcohol oxidase-like protein [Desarmillaria tabescens]KAK0463274.1 aryl-alcohol oxidase-like protein [Desarmillaria tabescens]